AHAPAIVDVTLQRNGGVVSTLAAAFEFRAGYVPSPAPTIAALEPATGPISGGTVLWMTGTNLTSGMQVFFGPAPAARVVLSDVSHAVITAPPGSAGLADVNVINPDGQAGALLHGFTFLARPTVVSVASALGAAAGSTNGGTGVTIAGTGFQTGATVLFGNAPATSVSVASAAIITAVTPAGPKGVADITVKNPDG